MAANVKFFDTNRINSQSGFDFTSADAARAYILYDNDNSNRLFSNGSNDSTPEVWTIEFSGAYDLDALAAFNHNIKSGNIQYWSGAAWANFSPAAAWTNSTDKNSYFEFTRVSTKQIRLTMNTTQIPNQDKYVGQLRALTSLGNLIKNPVEVTPKLQPKDFDYTTATGGSVYGIAGIKYQATVKFQNAPEADQTFLVELKTRNKQFYFYPCGGSGQTDVTFRVDDMYLVNFTGAVSPKLAGKNLFGIGIDTSITLKEV
ncbi:MAG: hypothetical protein LBJ25_07960 [Candidatus Margulisbacteria bacterium]|jgi:hypothetical protein|nr:hypothetical protein [Candidatus Margulisiibacteriota bacterium]